MATTVELASVIDFEGLLMLVDLIDYKAAMERFHAPPAGST